MSRKPHTNTALRQSRRRFARCQLTAGALALGAILSIPPVVTAGAAQLHAASTGSAAVAASSSCPQYANVADPPNIYEKGVIEPDDLQWAIQVSGFICFNGKTAWENSNLKCTAVFTNVPGSNYRGATFKVGYCAVTYNWGRYYFTASGDTHNPVLESHLEGLAKGNCPAGTG